MKKNLVIYTEGILITTLSGNRFPKGLWDFKISWPIWNAVNAYQPPGITLVSNEPWIQRGWVTLGRYHSKMSFLAASLADFLGLGGDKYIRVRYSLDGTWGKYLNGTEPILQGLSGIYLGRPQDLEEIQKFPALEFIDTQKFIEQYGTRKTIQRTTTGNPDTSGISPGTSSGQS